MTKTFPNLKYCKIYSRTTIAERRFILQMQKFCPNVQIIPCNGDYEYAVSDADTIVTAISGQEKILQANWIKACVFYCHVGGLEDDFSVPLKADKIVCDKWEAVKHRTQTISQMYQTGRQDNIEFIYFNSVGMSFVDIVALAN